MNEALRLQKTWKLLCKLLHWPIEKIFAFSYDKNTLTEPSLVVSNHVTNYDPLLVAITFPESYMHFVASEHLFRLGFVSKVLQYLVAPIARRKGSKGFDAAMNCLRKIRSGRSVCLFAEGETTWDGCSQPVYPATATVAKASGGSLVTYRLEGGYLTAPRWGKGIRRGKMRGSIVNVYTSQQLKTMTDSEIEAVINHDLFEDAYERQKNGPVRYRSCHGAERLEVALYMCPECKKIGTLKGKGSSLKCSCGFEVQYTEYGFFEPQKPFPTMREWQKWQHEQLLSSEFVHGEETLFADDNLQMIKILDGHVVQKGECGRLSATETELVFGSERYAYQDISDLALVTGRKILFTYKDSYYELRAPEPICLRKYLSVWQNAVSMK